MDTEKLKICPHCGEKVLAVAKKCRYCQTWFEDEGKHSVAEEKVELDNMLESDDIDTGCRMSEITVAFICLIAMFLILVDGAQTLNSSLFDNMVMDMHNVHGFWLSFTVFVLKLLCWFPAWLSTLLFCVVEAILLYALRIKLIKSGISSPGKGLMKTLVMITLFVAPFAAMGDYYTIDEELLGLVGLLGLPLIICQIVITLIVAVKLIKIPNFKVSSLGYRLIVMNVMGLLSGVLIESTMIWGMIGIIVYVIVGIKCIDSCGAVLSENKKLI